MRKLLLKYVEVDENVFVGSRCYKWVIYDNYGNVVVATNDDLLYNAYIDSAIYDFGANVYRVDGTVICAPSED